MNSSSKNIPGEGYIRGKNVSSRKSSSFYLSGVPPGISLIKSGSIGG